VSAAPQPQTRTSWLAWPILAGALVSLAMGIYGTHHKGQSVVLFINGFEQLVHVKALLALIVLAAALVQLFSALVMWGKIKAISPPSWIGTLHRWSGRIAFWTAVVIGVYCLYGVGFQTFSFQAAIHSTLGCLFFGVFVIKMLVLAKPGLKGWILPVVGGVCFTVLALVISTSALWYYFFGLPVV
jgi:hypothetical protein